MGGMAQTAFVPAQFDPPPPPHGAGFALVPLRVEHNEGDLDAWSSSVDHIHATPGFAGHPWPDEPMTLERNAGDLAGHEEDFAQRRGFTYSVVSDTGDEVIGCVYIYPSAKDDVGGRRALDGSAPPAPIWTRPCTRRCGNGCARTGPSTSLRLRPAPLRAPPETPDRQSAASGDDSTDTS